MRVFFIKKCCFNNRKVESIKYFISILICILTLLTPGCRKGAEDPLLSIHTRKARLCGDWKVTGGRTSYGNPDIYMVFKYENNGILEVNIGSNKINGSYFFEFKINKDGTYSIYETMSSPYTISYILNERGYWYFLGRNKANDNKSKESFVLQPLSLTEDDISYEYSDLPSVIYHITRLKNNEIKMETNRIYKKMDGGLTVHNKIFESLVLIPNDH